MLSVLYRLRRIIRLYVTINFPNFGENLIFWNNVLEI